MISKEKNFFLKLVKSERLKNLQTQKKKKKKCYGNNSYCFNLPIAVVRQKCKVFLVLLPNCRLSKFPPTPSTPIKVESPQFLLQLPGSINSSRKLQPPFPARTKEVQPERPVHSMNTQTKSYYNR